MRPQFAMFTAWDAQTYDRTSGPQQSWAADVLARLTGLAVDATVLDVGCGTGKVTELLARLVPRGRVLAIDASPEMVELARARLGEGATVWCQDALELTLEQPVDAVVSTAALHWVTDHERLWPQLAGVLRRGGMLEIQCGGEGNIADVREAIATASRELAPELLDWSPWTFASAEQTEERLRRAGFENVRCWLTDRPTRPDDLRTFVRTSILAGHLQRLAADRREAFTDAVVRRIRLPLQYVRLNASAVRGPDG